MMDDAARKRRHRNERIAAAILILVVSAVAVYVIRWRRSLDEAYERDRSYIPKPAVVTPEVNLLAEYVRIDTSTPEGVTRGAQWIASKLRAEGIEPELIESSRGRVNVYARIRGRDPGHGLILFNHIDVVAPGPNWSQPPFEARVVANQLYGRGTVDMKALAICQLLAFIDVAKSGRPPAHDLVFLATADEETGSEFGMRWIIANRPDVLEGIAFGITEGGITEILGERMTYFGIEIGGKQVVEATVLGDEAAVDRARIALEPFMTAREPDRILPEVRHYFREIAPTRLRFRNYLADIDRTVREGRFWILPVSYRDLAIDSVWVGGRYGEGPASGAIVKLINLPDTNPDERLAWLRSIVEPAGARIGEVLSKGGPGPLSPSDTPLFRLLAENARNRYRTEAGTQILFRSSSDSRFLRPLGIACYGVSPYPVDVYQSLAIHHEDERIRVDYFNDGVEYLRGVVRQWAEGR